MVKRKLRNRREHIASMAVDGTRIHLLDRDGLTTDRLGDFQCDKSLRNLARGGPVAY